MNDLSLSIIIPAYNEADSIIYCLKSTIEQNELPDEVIVVDNKSTDNTYALVEEFVKEYENSKNSDAKSVIIKLVQQNDKQGLIPTRNYGLDMATSQILGRIDADAILSPEWVSAVKEAFRSENTAGATGPVTYYDMPMRRFSFKQDEKIRKLIHSKSNNFPMMFGTNMAFRKSAWEQVRNEACLDEEDLLHEDIDISIHFSLNDLRVKYVEKMIAGMSARRIENKYKEFVDYQNRMVRTFEAHNIAPTKSALAARLIFLALWFPLHAIRPKYLTRFERMKEEYLEDLWKDGGKMDTFLNRRKIKKQKIDS